MKLKIFFLLAFALACREQAPSPERPLESLCAGTSEPPRHREFYWDDVRAHDPELWSRAISLCESCPKSSQCGPVLSVERWYAEPHVAPTLTLPQQEKGTSP